jgi:antitoxin VapB
MHQGTAKVFWNGGSQTVRLPVESRIDTTEVIVQRIGQSLLITPKRAGGWDEFFNRPSAVPADFLAERADEPPQSRDLV